MTVETNISGNFDTQIALVDRYGSGANVVQIDFNGAITGSVTIFGRVRPDAAWVQIGDPITSNALVPILPVPLLRYAVSVATGAGGAGRIRAGSTLQ